MFLSVNGDCLWQQKKERQSTPSLVHFSSGQEKLDNNNLILIKKDSL